ncbi:MAG: VOC family protein [Alphaproteobacteria bacterium]
MGTKIFVNLPVKRLDRSVAFFTALGFGLNDRFTDDTAACMIIADDIHAMLLTEAKFREFTRKPIADATRTTEVLTALSMDSRGEVDRMVDAALAAGATPVSDAIDMGFMYLRSFNDLDGHIWEIFWMDQAHVEAG